MVRTMMLLTAIIFLCVSIYTFAHSRSGPSYITLAERLRDQHIHEMTKDGFSVTMTGGAFPTNVQSIAVGFALQKKMTNIAEARTLYVNGVERFLNQINNDEAIRPFLQNYPFTANNLDYEMDFQWLSCNNDEAPIVYITLTRGIIAYFAKDPASIPLKAIHRESYSNALKIVQEKGQLPKPVFVGL